MANGNGRGIRLGKGVTYTDANGLKKAAIVTGTLDSVTEGTDVPVPAKGTAHLQILHPTDPTRNYTRTNIPLGDGPRTFAVA